MKKYLCLIFVVTLLLISGSATYANTPEELYYGSGAIRSMSMKDDGTVIGGRSSGHTIEVWTSSNRGESWTKIGTVASNDNINYGDVMFMAVSGTDKVYCAFREKNAEGKYSVVVCRSDNGGYNWVYDSTVISGCSQFVGAPWLFVTQNGDMQCYYDSEPLAAENGVSGAQWIAMQGRDGLTGAWNKYGVVAASRDADSSKFVRDGMASVVDLGNNRIMVVTEGIEDNKSGGVYSNVVRAIQSNDGGYTWNYSGRKIVYQSTMDSASGRRYNAYCPMAVRVGNGPVGVVFCTDEDFKGTPDSSSEDVSKRRTHIKYIRTMDNFETWGLLTDIWTGGSKAYAPGIVETSRNNILISIDHFSGNQRFYHMDTLGKNNNYEVIPGTGNLLYSTNFGDSYGLDFYPGLVSNTPVYNENVMSINGGNSNKVVVSGNEFTDFVVEADISVKEDGSKDSNQGGIIFRVNNPYSGVSDGYDGYYFGIDALKKEVILGKVHQNKWTEIAKKKMTIEYNKYYRVSVAVAGNEIKGYVNYNGENYAKIVAVDNDFSSGTVGFRHWLSGASFKNLSVFEYNPKTPEKTYTNSVLNSCADPDVLYYKGMYYLYATNTENANLGFKVYSSTDLVNWTDRGWALSKNDVYGDSGFWAPDLIEKDGKFYMYYVANEHLSVATSDSPLGPFTQTKEEQKPMHEGKEIDAHVFKDDDGQYYIYFVRFYGKSGVSDGNYICGAKLNSDMRTMDDSTITCLISPEEAWETNKAKVAEGPFMLKKDGVYYLTYSGSHFESDYYGSGYATATSPLGNYTKYENNPIMQSNTLVHGAGHHGIVSSPDGSEMFIVYHCHSSLTKTEPRRLCIDRIHFTKDDAGKTVLEVYGPTITPQGIPKSGNTISKGIEINGYQISATLGGMRTVYSVDSVINQKEVIGYGMLYSLADYADEEDMHVGSSSKYVKSVEGTKNGQLSINASDSDIASSYAMTVCFTSKQAAEYTDKWTVKAYAKLIDGTYVYSDAKTFCAYDVADILYKNSMMNNISAHNYLYENILTLVNKEYIKVEYSKSSVVR